MAGSDQSLPSSTTVKDPPCADTAQYSRYAQYPEYIEIVFDEKASLPSGDEFHQELGSRFAVTCQELGAKLDLDPGALADAYIDPVAFDAHGDEVDMFVDLTSAQLPVTFKFKKQPKKYHLMTGLQGAGKSSIINRLKMSVGRDVLHSTSENGFSVKTLELDDFASIVAWSAPLSEENPLAWQSYSAQAVSLIFVVDCADHDALKAAQVELQGMLHELDSRKEAAVLVYANKKDIPGSLSSTALAERLDIARLCQGRRWFVQASAAARGDGVYQGINHLSRMLTTDEGEDDTGNVSTEEHRGAATSEPVTAAAAEVVLSPEDARIAELVLECIHNDGVDVLSMPASNRTIVFLLSGAPKDCMIGRLHQPGFFEALIPRQDRLLAISRTHFTISVTRKTDASVICSLKHMSKNPLILDNIRRAGKNDEVPVGDGTWIGVKDLTPGEGPFLVLRVTLRTQGAVNQDGSLFSEVEALQLQRSSSLQVAQTTMSLPRPILPVGKPVAVLECIFTAGRDITLIPPSARCISLQSDTPVEIGRLCQPGFFEYLLNNESRWLGFLSRRHCELTLTSNRSWWGLGTEAYSLAVENLSNNTVFLEKHPLAKEEWDELAEGGVLSFAASADGQSQQFLRFVFRKIANNEDAAAFSAFSTRNLDCLNGTLWRDPRYAEF